MHNSDFSFLWHDFLSAPKPLISKLQIDPQKANKRFPNIVKIRFEGIRAFRVSF